MANSILDRLLKAENDTLSLRIKARDAKHGMTPLRRVSLNGYAECIRYMIGAEADVRIHPGEEERRTALGLAYEGWALVRQGGSYETVISLLIEQDPPAAKDDAELFGVCAMFGSSDLILHLQTIGANFNLQD
ncbi:hypothetical protein F4782DRAFT_531288 [Xylaria castorea]|nr:hypothetical protein F4782DRAFT_531288 [Xylaria castorea]